MKATVPQLCASILFFLFFFLLYPSEAIAGGNGSLYDVGGSQSNDSADQILSLLPFGASAAKVRLKLMKKIGIIAEYTPSFEPHVATSNAIEHSRDFLGVEISYEWTPTNEINDDFFETCDGLWVGPGSPYKDMDQAIWAIQYAREQGIPTIGTCGGFQHIILEYARNLLGFKDAQHAENDPYASNLFISELTCSLAGREMELRLQEGSRVARIYGLTDPKESYYCNFAVNPDYLEEIRNGPIVISGSDSEGEVRVVEYPDHPFFIATLFVPQTRSTPQQPHPLVNAFVEAVVRA